MKTFYRTLLVLGVIFLGLSCSKTYNLPPLSASGSGPTSTPNPLICPPTPTPGPPPGSIYWYSAQVEGITVNNGVTIAQGIFAQVLLTVNGVAESTDTVSVVGPGGLNALLPYTSNVVQNGNTYAQYQVLLPNTYQPGGNYSLTTATSLGPASVTLVGPGNISVASDGSSANWTQPGALNRVVLQRNPMLLPLASPATLYQTAACSTENSSVQIPLSNYSNSALYTVTVDCQNMTTFITGGMGFYKVYQDYVMMLGVNMTPTATPIVCGGGGPTCTPTPVGTPTVYSVTISPSPYKPALGTANLNAIFPYMSGPFRLAIYDTSGFLARYLSVQQFNANSSGFIIGTWDGTDSLNNPAPDGVYVVSYQEPSYWDLVLVLLIR